MSVLTALRARFTARHQSAAEQAARAYRELVSAVLANEPPPDAEIESTLQAAGRSLADLEADVARSADRGRLLETLDKEADLRRDLDAVTQERNEAEEQHRQVEEAFRERLADINERTVKLNAELSGVRAARVRLRELLAPEERDRLKAAEARVGQLLGRLGELRGAIGDLSSGLLGAIRKLEAERRSAESSQLEQMRRGDGPARPTIEMTNFGRPLGVIDEQLSRSRSELAACEREREQVERELARAETEVRLIVRGK